MNEENGKDHEDHTETELETGNKEENGKEHEDNKEMELETEIDNLESNNNSNKRDKFQSNLRFITKLERNS